MKKIHLLLVDDEQEFRDATRVALSRRGYEVTTASDGNEALQILRRQTFDIILLDLRMPVMNGIDTLVEIRKDLSEIPVIILTGHGGLDNAVAGIRLGIVDFVQKPVDIDFLGAHIRKLLQSKKEPLLKEKEIKDFVIPEISYRKVYEDQSVREAIKELQSSLFPNLSSEVSEQGHRTILVYTRQEIFLGALRLNDILELALPAVLRGSPYASYLTGMFVAQCKLVGNERIKDIIGELIYVDIDAPLIEAISIMVTKRLINLPVFREGKFCGILRDKDILLEMSNFIAG